VGFRCKYQSLPSDCKVSILSAFSPWKYRLPFSAIVKTDPAVIVTVLVVAAIIYKPKKLLLAPVNCWLPLPLKETTPALWLKVPLLVQLPVTLKLLAVVVVPENVRPLKVKVPELVILPPEKVIVSPLAIKLPVTDRAVATVKLVAVVTPVPLITKLP
jgi:hypothetical protein